MKNKIKCAKELNKVLGVSPALPTDDSVSESVMDKKLKKAATMLTETEIEELSEVSVNVLTALGCEGFEAAEESEKEEDVEETPAPKKGKAKKEEPADDDDDDDDDQPKKGKKVAMKEEKETPAPKVKKEKKEKTPYSRIQAMAEVLKKKPNMERTEAVEKADALYSEKTGKDNNVKEQAYSYSRVIEVMSVFELL